MQVNHNPIQGLVHRVQEGDSEAKEQLQIRLKWALPLIIRPILDRGTACTVLERNVLSAAKRLLLRGRHRDDVIVAQVAEGFCQLVIDRLCPGNTNEFCQETLRE